MTDTTHPTRILRIDKAELETIPHFNYMLRLRLTLTPGNGVVESILTFNPKRLHELLEVANVKINEDGNTLDQLVGQPVMLSEDEDGNTHMTNIYNPRKTVTVVD